jgi:hypothetical protein
MVLLVLRCCIVIPGVWELGPMNLFMRLSKGQPADLRRVVEPLDFCHPQWWTAAKVGAGALNLFLPEWHGSRTCALPYCRVDPHQLTRHL